MNVKNKKSRAFYKALISLYGERYLALYQMTYPAIHNSKNFKAITSYRSPFTLLVQVSCQPYKLPGMQFFHLRLLVTRLLGNGVFTVPDYESWKPKRKIYDQTFTKRFVLCMTNSWNDTF